jgi:hypothetical protein
MDDLLQELVETLPECTFKTNWSPCKEMGKFPVSNRFRRGRLLSKILIALGLEAISKGVYASPKADMQYNKV